MKKYHTAAEVRLYRPADYSKQGLKRIVSWLRKVARDLAKNNKKMSKRYRARYLYR